MTITDDTAAKLREVAEKATPGPWDHDGPEHSIIVWSSGNDRVCFMTSDGPEKANAAFIAAANPLMVLALLDHLASEKARADAAEAALELCMVGGNHIASVLVGSLGGGFPLRYPADMDHEEALRSLRATDTYEVWCCWSAIMRARAVSQLEAGKVKPEQIEAVMKVSETFDLFQRRNGTYHRCSLSNDEITAIGAALASPSPAVDADAVIEAERLRRMVERRDEFIIGHGLWDAFKGASDDKD